MYYSSLEQNIVPWTRSALTALYSIYPCLQDNFAHPEIEWGAVTNDPRCGVSAIRRCDDKS